jgi:uncharacterized protein YndB with AHSA1/START domain
MDFVFERVLDAPRNLVFAAWTEEDHLKQWFAPIGFTIPVCRLNLVPGGIFHYCMRAPNGVEMWGKWIFQEIVLPERIVLVNTFSNKHGNLTRHPYVPEWPLEMLTAITLIEAGAETRVRLAWAPVNASLAEQKTFESMHDAMTQGWNGTFDQLAAYLSAMAGD